MNHGLLRFIAPLLLTLLSLNAQAVEEVIHYHNDALGSPIAATDQEGRVVWRKSYAPYGQPIGPGASNEPGYTGKFEEPDLGIQNFGARWYDPRIGRFLAIDPVGFDPQNPQSFNRYAYANNNPYKYVDPNGESPLDVGFFIVDTVSLGFAVASGDSSAIQSGAFDFTASAVGLASPIPGTGLAIKAARAADKVSDAASVLKGVAPAKRASNQTVLGGYPDYAKLSDELGARRFDIPTDIWSKMALAQQWAANQKFLDRMISKGDEVILSNSANKAQPGTFFAREIDYLTSQGYRVSDDGLRMLPGH